MARSKCIVVKVGTSSVFDERRALNKEILQCLVSDIACLWDRGKEVILVASGAMAMGGEHGDSTLIAAARGQHMLMSEYAVLFGQHGISVGQMLVTRDNFVSAEHSVRFSETIATATRENTLMIVNENDAIANMGQVTFGENDALAVAVSIACSAGLMVFISYRNSNVAGRGGWSAKSAALSEAKRNGINPGIIDIRADRHALLGLLRSRGELHA